jgi:hypothetical protein
MTLLRIITETLVSRPWPGTRLKLWGDLKGDRKDGVVTHTFGYFGVPTDIKKSLSHRIIKSWFPA